MKDSNKINFLKTLKNELAPIFKEITKKLLIKRSLTDRNLDFYVLNFLKDKAGKANNIKISFSKPKDKIYDAEAGRTPYDFLCFGKINKIPFKIFINNKLGNIKSSARNDITTYNNLLRLYLDIKEQRLTEKIEIDKNTIYKKIAGEEIISYGVFALDKENKKYNFFLLEEINNDFYINPRNTMFQISYAPKLKNQPMDYFDFISSLIDSTIISLRKSINKAKTEIIVLRNIKSLILEIGKL